MMSVIAAVLESNVLRLTERLWTAYAAIVGDVVDPTARWRVQNFLRILAESQAALPGAGPREIAILRPIMSDAMTRLEGYASNETESGAARWRAVAADLLTTPFKEAPIQLMLTLE